MTLKLFPLWLLFAANFAPLQISVSTALGGNAVGANAHCSAKETWLRDNEDGSARLPHRWMNHASSNTRIIGQHFVVADGTVGDGTHALILYLMIVLANALPSIRVTQSRGVLRRPILDNFRIADNWE